MGRKLLLSGSKLEQKQYVSIIPRGSRGRLSALRTMPTRSRAAYFGEMLGMLALNTTTMYNLGIVYRFTT